jgi:hypothetical protein
MAQSIAENIKKIREMHELGRGLGRAKVGISW